MATRIVDLQDANPSRIVDSRDVNALRSKPTDELFLLYLKLQTQFHKALSDELLRNGLLPISFVIPELLTNENSTRYEIGIDQVSEVVDNEEASQLFLRQISASIVLNILIHSSRGCISYPTNMRCLLGCNDSSIPKVYTFKVDYFLVNGHIPRLHLNTLARFCPLDALCYAILRRGLSMYTLCDERKLDSLLNTYNYLCLFPDMQQCHTHHIKYEWTRFQTQIDTQGQYCFCSNCWTTDVQLQSQQLARAAYEKSLQLEACVDEIAKWFIQLPEVEQLYNLAIGWSDRTSSFIVYAFPRGTNTDIFLMDNNISQLVCNERLHDGSSLSQHLLSTFKNENNKTS